ncbi:MAG: nucleotidyltransferase domain-containing protein [Bryobacteraceae bacterium]|jgi:predicted nucleotidyltransferase
MESVLPPLVREKMIEIAARHGAGNLELFGSAARGELRPDSDVDLLLDIVGPTPPWFPGGLAVELEGLLGRPVQLVIRRSLSPLIRESALGDSRPL